jgi:diaminopimelate epimerase
MPPILGLASTAPTTPEAAESRHGFATTGVPHLVVLVEDAESVDVAGRGQALRRDASLGPAGANVNFVSVRPDASFRMRTFERGVEGETLACGTGSVATAALLRAWGLAGDQVLIQTSSGLVHEVGLPRSGDAAPQLSGEGRVVFEGRFGTL